MAFQESKGGAPECLRGACVREVIAKITLGDTDLRHSRTSVTHLAASSNVEHLNGLCYFLVQTGLGCCSWPPSASSGSQESLFRVSCEDCLQPSHLIGSAATCKLICFLIRFGKGRASEEF